MVQLCCANGKPSTALEYLPRRGWTMARSWLTKSLDESLTEDRLGRVWINPSGAMIHPLKSLVLEYELWRAVFRIACVAPTRPTDNSNEGTHVTYLRIKVVVSDFPFVSVDSLYVW